MRGRQARAAPRRDPTHPGPGFRYGSCSIRDPPRTRTAASALALVALFAVQGARARGAGLPTFVTPLGGTDEGNSFNLALGGHALLVGTSFNLARVYDVEAGILRLEIPCPSEPGGGGDQCGTLVAASPRVFALHGPDRVYAFDQQGHALPDLVVPKSLQTVPLAAKGFEVLVRASTDTAGGPVTEVHLFDASTGALLRTFVPPSDADGSFGRSGVFAGGKIVISSSTAVLGFEASSGRLRWTTPLSISGLGAPGQSLVPLSGRDVLARGATTLYRLDGRDGALLQTYQLPNAHPLWEGFSASRGSIVVGDTGVSPDGGVHVLDPRTGALRETLVAPAERLSDRLGDQVVIDGSRIVARTGLFEDNTGYLVGFGR